jgi:hypothetical protein
MMSALASYISGVFLEGLLIGFIFWFVTYITIESSSLSGALRAGLMSEAIGNIPYLWGLPATSPPSMLMSLLAAIIFVRLIMRIGELNAFKAIYGIVMCYFILTALVTCNA